jgi:hypothetical protein
MQETIVTITIIAVKPSNYFVRNTETLRNTYFNSMRIN